MAEPIQRARGGALPNLLVIGAQKCGTSSLHYYLDLHPEIAMSSPKELDFFGGPPDSSVLTDAGPADRRLVDSMGGNQGRDERWYAEHFSAASPVRGESSPSYMAPWHPDCAAQVDALLGGVRAIALVRNPLTQIQSSWQHESGLGRESRPLAEAVVPGGVYVERARYRARLEPYLQRLGAERLLVLSHEELLRDRRETMQRVFTFCGVDPEFFSPRMERLRHVTAEKTTGRKLLERVQSSRLAKPIYKLPGELRWIVERGVSRRSTDGTAPELDDPTKEWVCAELGPDAAWLAAEFGIDTSGWLR